jgi:hypothetical protein
MPLPAKLDRPIYKRQVVNLLSFTRRIFVLQKAYILTTDYRDDDAST